MGNVVYQPSSPIAHMNNYKIGLALSGGGYRAAAFHVGTLRAFHKLGILEKVDVISTISGGSITGSCYCLITTWLQASSSKSRLPRVAKRW